MSCHLRSNNQDGTTCMISGWGDVNQKENGIQRPEILQVAFVQIANFETCAEKFGTFGTLAAFLAKFWKKYQVLALCPY